MGEILGTRRARWAAGIAALALIIPTAAAAIPEAADEALQREPLLTPEDLADGAIDGLQYADPTEGLVLVEPPEASPDGSASVSYPLEIPPGRGGVAPELALTYASDGDNGWVGLGWDLSVGEVAVDTTFGAPHFSSTHESESYTLDDELLVPNALGGAWEERVRGDRRDYVRQVETEYEEIIRHEVGSGGPANYYWEVRDKQGGVRWYGGHPDAGGPDGELVDGPNGQPLRLDEDAVVRDENGNIVRWLLSAQRDVGVNLIRYHYRTLQYRPSGVGEWTRVDSCDPDDDLCARHTYLSRIDYTAAAEASGHPEDPAYQVHFRLAPQDAERRADPVVDASLGYVDLVAERLARVEVLHGTSAQPEGPRTYDPVAARYDLGYEEGPFGKSLLTTIEQGATTGESAVHTFAYNRDGVTSSGDYAGFADGEDWDTWADLETRDMLDVQVSPGTLSVSETNSGEANAYVGFNLTSPMKAGSVGGAIEAGGGDTEGKLEFVDINGDDLPDKVFLDGNTVKYRLNQSGPDGGIAFSDPPTTIVGLNGLSEESKFSVQPSIESFIVLNVGVGLGFEHTWSDHYFTDVNSDGLPDYVSNGTVLFNRLVNGVPRFVQGSTGTFVPIGQGAQPDVGSDTQDAIRQRLAAESPPIDTVRRWIAPYAGTVSIDAPVTLDPPSGASPDGVRVAIQHNGAEIAEAELDATGQQAFTAAVTRSVNAGDRLYFRVHSGPDGVNDEVDWSPTVTYTAIAGIDSDDFDDVPDDVNNLSQTEFDAESDFTISGRPGASVTMPFTGRVRFTGAVTKGVTTDELRLTLLHEGAQVPGSSITFPEAAGTFPVQVDFDVAAPVLDDQGRPVSQDTVRAYLAVDSPIDLTVVDWAPTLTYLSGTDRAGEPLRDPSAVMFDLPPEIEQYPDDDTNDVVRPFRSDTEVDGAFATVSLDRVAATTRTGEAVVTVKTRAGVQARATVDIPATPPAPFPPAAADVTSTVPLDTTLAADTDYWIDVSIRNAEVAQTFGSADVQLRPTETGTPVNVTETLRKAAIQGIFPLPYRGWGVAGYTAGGTKGTQAMAESAFVVDESRFDDLPTGQVDPEDAFDQLDSRTPGPDPSIAYTPTRSPVDPRPGSSALAGEHWTGPRDNLAASATRVRSSLYARDSLGIGATPSGSGITAPVRIGDAGPTFGLSLGLGPAGVQLGVGNSFGTVDYEDMNGDGYPDVMKSEEIHFTRQDGAFLEDATDVGSDLAHTNQDFTVTAGAGLDVDVPKIVTSNKGQTNSSQGQAAGKGGDASDDGASLGVGVEFEGSWTNPNLSGEVNGPIVDGQTTDPLGTFGGSIADMPVGDLGDGVVFEIEYADVNADGLPDRVFTTAAGVFAQYNLGYSFTEDAIQLADGGFVSQESYAGGFSLGFTTPWKDFGGGVSFQWNVDLSRYLWEDLNGDGLLDQIHKPSAGGSPTVRFGTGSGLLSSESYGNFADAAAAFGVDAGQQSSFDRAQAVGGALHATFPIGPLCPPPVGPGCYIIVNPGGSYQNTLTSSEVALTDVDGDGYADSVASTDDDDLEVHRNLHGRTNLLETVTNPLGGQTRIEYEREGNTVAHPESMWVMSRVEVDDGRPGDGADVAASTFDYEDPRFDRMHRRSLGFARVVERELDTLADVDPTTGDWPVYRVNTRSFLNDSVFVAGIETGLVVHDPNTPESEGNFLRGETLTWGFRDVLDLSGDVLDEVEPLGAGQLGDTTSRASFGRSIAPLLVERTVEFYDTGNVVGQQERSTYSYDGLGNVLRQTDHGETENLTDDVATALTYSTCATSWSAPEDCPDATAPAPTRSSPLWSPNLCPTWVSLPATASTTNGLTGADLVRYRERDGAPELCDNASVTVLTETTDESGGEAVTELAYDDWGSYDRIVYPEGADGVRRAVQYVYDTDRHTDVAETTELDFDDPQEVADFLDYDDPDVTEAVPLRTGLTTTATFDPLSGRVASRTDANGETYSYTYDGFGRIATLSTPLADDLVVFDYHQSDAEYAYATARHLDQNRSTAQDPAYIRTWTFVDGVGRVTQTKRDARLFDADGEPTIGRIVSGASVVDPFGRETEQWYPIRDSQAEASTFEPGRSPDGTGTFSSWSLWDQVEVLDEPGEDPDGNGPEPAARRVSTTEYLYSELSPGLTVYSAATTDPRGRVRTVYTDVRDTVLSVWDQPADVDDPLVTTYEYDGLAQLLRVTDTAGNETTHAWDLLGRRTSTTTPDAGLEEYTYDAEGKLVSVTSPNQRAAGTQTTYSYELGKLVLVDHPNGTPDVTYEYGTAAAADINGAGRVVRSEDGARIVDYEYDGAGNITQQTAEMKLHNWSPDVADPERFRWTTSWTYDGLGRLAAMQYPDEERVSYGYDEGGLLRSVQGEEDGFRDVVIGVDPEGNPIVVQEPVTWQYPYVNDRQYDEFLRRVHTELGNEVTTDLTFDPHTLWLERVRSVSPQRDVHDHPADYQEIQDLRYGYDVVGNPLTYQNALPPTVPDLFGGPVSQEYEYDPFDRVVGGTGSWTATNGQERTYEFELAYDEHGNVVTKDQEDLLGGRTQRATTYSWEREYGGAGPHQVTTEGSNTYHYDQNGNLLGVRDRRDRWVRELTWDDTNRLRVVDDSSNSTTYKYDDTGQLAIERGPGGEIAFINPWVTVNNGTVTFKHIWAGDERVATQRDPGDGGGEELQRYFLHTDLQGSTNIVSDYRGNTFQRHEYFPTGEVWIGQLSTEFRTPYQYGGGYTDEQRDLIGFGARWYDPGREMLYSPDPILVDDPYAVVDTPELRAAYGFAGSNPLTNVDPSGRMFTWANLASAYAAQHGYTGRLAHKRAMVAVVAQGLLNTVGDSIKRAAASETAKKVQSAAEAWDTAPLIQYNPFTGEIKLSAGFSWTQKTVREGTSGSPTGAAPPPRPTTPAPAVPPSQQAGQGGAPTGSNQPGNGALGTAVPPQSGSAALTPASPSTNAPAAGSVPQPQAGQAAVPSTAGPAAGPQVGGVAAVAVQPQGSGITAGLSGSDDGGVARGGE